MKRHAWGAAAAAGVLAACGGGALIALAPVVGPIGGQWQQDVPPASPTLEPVAGEFFNVDPTGDAADRYPTEASYPVTGIYGSRSGPCAAADPTDPNDSIDVAGTVDGDLIVLNRQDAPTVECLRGRFTDARTVEIGPTTRYRNNTVQFAFDRHEWVNADDTTQRFRFTNDANATDDSIADLAGCRRIGNGPRADFSARLAGYSTTANVGPRILDFTVGGTNFGIGELPSPREIEFGRQGGPRLLLRRVLAGPTPLDCSAP